jgi:hypothetical protein
VRLYAPVLAGTVRPAASVETSDEPFRIAFNPPDGARIAVGYYDAPRVDVLDGHTLANLASSDEADVPAVDVDRNGLITPSGLEHYVENRVPMLTQDRRHPGMEVRYDTTLFARSR